MEFDPGWYPVGLSGGLAPGTLAGTRLFGRELVIWRDASGACHAWEDRCPHRGMRLSFGFVRNDHIACLYHGWQFDGGARCRYIPAHPDLEVPGSICVATYAAVERLGIIWAYSEVNVDEPGVAPPDEWTPVTPVRSLSVDVSPAGVLEMLSETPAKRTGTAWTRACGGDTVILALQPVASNETVLHLVVAGAPEIHRGAGQKRVSAWGEALRRQLEARENTSIPSVWQGAAW
ncbi:Rieske (2Fe-2S) protein [Bradyrhizobium sp. WD16]|uniref:Rieske (2Fe-2S) protein n=1 Tax=Bradyrhizobium sp. WD16 TaxID=1521768 RepID=UPI0020A5B29E|nr:Rieske (2Fe-2S) protein [Bradyrhizobium sp. WD16]UTD28267.1 oxidoreductase [Bradyrhizobium sp. WD16]